MLLQVNHIVNQMEKYNMDYNQEGNKNYDVSSVTIGPYLHLYRRS